MARRLASSSDDGNVCLWNSSDGTLIWQIQGHRGIAASVAWSPDGKWLASGGGRRSGGELFVWNVQSGERTHIFAESSAMINAVAWDFLVGAS